MTGRLFDPLSGWRADQRGPRRASFFNWIGGKGRLAARVTPELPQARIYVEPYAGGGAVFLRRDPSEIEVINDLDGEVANFYRVLRDEPRALMHRIAATPYARASFVEALRRRGLEVPPVERAANFFVRRMQGFAGKGRTPGNWGRSFQCSRGMAGQVSAWRGQLGALRVFHDRVSRAYIDNACALDVIRFWDTPETLFYCDPPYLPETRRSRNDYACEPDAAHHVALVAQLMSVAGAAAVSCYDAPIYAPLREAGWRRVEWATVCFAQGRPRGGAARGEGGAFRAAPRTEVLYVSPRADAMRAEEATDAPA